MYWRYSNDQGCSTLKDWMEVKFLDCMSGMDFMQPGHRNNDGVNFSIVCYCLGRTPMTMLEQSDAFKSASPDDKDRMREVIERVDPYLESWCISLDDNISFRRGYSYMI